MKKLAAIILCYVMLFSLAPMAIVGADATGTTYYVSPNGSDSNPGTEELPWATMYKAAQTLTAGDTAIFENGTYNETQYTEFVNDGTADAPITLKARNQHQAVIMYDEALRLQKLRLHKSYINIRDFAITQEVASTAESERPTLDILLDCGYSKADIIEGCEITGNRFYNVYEEGIKARFVRNVLIKDNIIESPAHEGMDIFGCADMTICGNEIINCGRTGIMVKGNTRNSIIYNNKVHNDEVACSQGYTLGGQSDSTSPYVVASGVGYEAYHCVFYNNIAYSAQQGLMATGFSFSGAKDCHAYNNVSVGATNGFVFSSASDERNGWGWDPPTVNPVLKNNIVTNANKAYSFNDVPDGLVSDYNLFYNITDLSSIPTDANGSYADPKFLDRRAGDFHLELTSPARQAGTAVPASVAGYPGIEGVDEIDENKTVAINLVDLTYATRQLPWDMGVYNRGNDIGLSEDFETYDEADTSISSPWTYQGTSVDKTVKTWSETGAEPANMAAKFTAKTLEESGMTANSERKLYLLKYDFGQTLEDDYLKIAFRIRSNDANSSVFNTLIGSYTVSTDFQKIKSNGVSIAALDVGEWYDFEYYVDVANNKLSINYEGNRVVDSINAAIGTLSNIRFGLNRTSCGNSAEIILDDIQISVIDEKEYNDALGIVTEEVLFDEDFSGAKIGDVVKDWNRITSSYETKNGSTNTYAIDPENSENTVINFESKRQKISAWNKVYYGFVETLTDGRYSYKFKLRATDSDSGEFWVTFKDDAGKTSYIILDFPDQQIRVQEWYLKSDNTIATSTRTMSVPLQYNYWHNFEFILDLTDEAQLGRSRVSISLDGTAVVNTNSENGDFGLGTTGTYSNNGTLTEVGLAIATGATATTLIPTTVEGGTGIEGTDVFANFMADDLEFKSLITE